VPLLQLQGSRGGAENAEDADLVGRVRT